MNKILISTGLLSILCGCEKIDIPKGTPRCIEEKINKIAKEEVWNPPAEIYSYQYKGQTVYHFPPRCCDIPGALYDESCTLICSPDGGFNGNGDGQCSDFFSSRTDAKLIWKDPRK